MVVKIDTNMPFGEVYICPLVKITPLKPSCWQILAAYMGEKARIGKKWLYVGLEGRMDTPRVVLKTGGVIAEILLRRVSRS